MNFKTISTIISLLSFNLLVLSSSVKNVNSTDAIDISINEVEDSQNFTNDEVFESSSDEEINFYNDNEEVSEIIDEEDVNEENVIVVYI